jgi:hypothetical protein
VSLHQMVKELAAYLLGWRAYFGFCETPTIPPVPIIGDTTSRVRLVLGRGGFDG